MSELKWPSEEEVRKMFAKKEGFGSDATLSAAMQLPEVRAMVSQLEAWLEVAKHCSITEGVCCCGDDMKGHADPMDCGHTSTDHGTYHAHMLVKSTQSALAAIKEPKL